MRAGVFQVLLLSVFFVGCRKEKTDPAVSPTPTAIVATVPNETPPAAAIIDIELPNTAMPVAMGIESAQEPVERSGGEVEQALQRNQQIVDNLIRRLVRSSPATE